jgi:hypothetical protein
VEGDSESPSSYFAQEFEAFLEIDARISGEYLRLWEDVESVCRHLHSGYNETLPIVSALSDSSCAGRPVTTGHDAVLDAQDVGNFLSGPGWPEETRRVLDLIFDDICLLEYYLDYLTRLSHAVPNEHEHEQAVGGDNPSNGP